MDKDFELRMLSKVDKKFDVVFDKLDKIQTSTSSVEREVAVIAAQRDGDKEKLDTHIDTHPVQPCKDLVEHKKTMRWVIGLSIPILVALIALAEFIIKLVKP